MLFENQKRHFTAKRHILEKKVKSTTPPFMAILPTRYPLKPDIVNILGLKSDFDFFGVADYASGRKISFLVVVVGGFEDTKKVFNKKVLYWYPAHTLKWALQNNFTLPPP